MKKTIFGLLMLLVSAVSCFKDNNFSPGQGSSEPSSPAERLPVEETRRVMIMYSAGFNTLSSYLKADLDEMVTDGFVPQAQTRDDQVLLIFSRLSPYGASVAEAPVLYRLYKDQNDKPVRDTLYRFQPEDQASDPAVLTKVLELARHYYPAKGYGLVLSSHGAGWLESRNTITESKVRSVGQDYDTDRVHEMEVKDFAKAIPYPLDYILFDCCFMGCVEVAWELRDVTPLIGFSPTEIVADGFDYKLITTRLLAPQPDVLAVCEDYYAQYIAPQQTRPYATITLVDTQKLQPLANICKTLFQKYRSKLATLSMDKVQHYYRDNGEYRYYHFFDLRHMLVQAGITEQETAQLDQALDGCILYERHTPRFFSLDLINICGLSVYMPSSGNATIDAYYKDHVAWNQATQLIQ